MDPVGLLSLVLYTLGVFTFGALSTLWLRSAMAGDPGGNGAGMTGRVKPVEGVFLVVTFVWFVLNLLHTFAAVETRLDRPVLNILVFSVAFLFPPLLFHFYTGAAARAVSTGSWRLVSDQAVHEPPRSLLWRLVFWGLYVVSPLLGAVVLGAGLAAVTSSEPVGSDHPAVRLLNAGGAVLGVMMTIALIFGFLGFKPTRPQEDRSERSRRVGMRGLLALIIGLMTVVTLGNLGIIRFTELLRTLVYSTPLLASFGSIYLTDRYTFVDLFIKRGLALLGTVVALTLYFAVVLPWLPLEALAWAAPWVLALAVLPVAVSLPWLYRRLGTWVDRSWFGRRYTTVEAVKRFLSNLERATTEDQLVERAEEGLTAIFRAEAQVALTTMPGRVAEHLEPRVEVALSGTPSPGAVRLGPRAGGAPFLSEDRLLLDSLVEVLAHLLENIRLHAREQAQDRRARELSLQASRSDLKALRAQINPHFLFNALNAIAGLIHSDPARADRTVEQLAEVFRHTLRRSRREWARLEEELDLVRAYLDVEQARFGTRLECEVVVAPEAASAVVPTMMLQTLVENAVKHGISAVRGGGHIGVEVATANHRLTITVWDNGPGPGADTEEPPAGGGFGLSNISQRLSGYYGAEATFTLARDDEAARTVARLELPLTTAMPAPGEGAQSADLAAR